MPSFAVHSESIEGRQCRRFALNVWMVLAVAGAVLVMETESRATCGDYLTSHGKIGPRWEGSVEHSVPPISSHGAIPHRSPCRGPSCQQGPMEAPSPSVVSLQIQDEWISIVRFVDQRGALLGLLMSRDESLILPLIAFRLERPPKCRFLS